MAIRLWLSLLMLLFSSFAVAGGTKFGYDIFLKGDIRIGPDGGVREYRLQTELSPKIAEVVDRNVRAWKFRPILVDGKPVAAKTAMSLWLSAEPSENDTYTLMVRNVQFGSPERLKEMMWKAPKYPVDAIHAYLGAKVILALKLDAQGKVTDAWAEQVSLNKRVRESHASRWRNLFAKSSIEAAKHWKFDPTESIDGTAVGAIVRTPILYSLSDGSRPTDADAWHAYIPGPVQPNPWEATEPPTQADFDALKEGDVRSLASRFQLLDNVIGETL